MKYPKETEIGLEKIEDVTSTNDYLSQLCKNNETKEFYTVWAERQTAGRGQRGNSWESEPGKNLTFSMVLYPTVLKARQQFYLSMLVSTAVVYALNNYTKGFSIKWPNDIYWNDKKIAGILIENELEGNYVMQSIVGIGLNVNQELFHSSIPNPISLKQILGVEIDRKELFEKLLNTIIGGYLGLEEHSEKIMPSINKQYLKSLYRKNGYHLYRDAQGTFCAQYEDMDTDGHLYLRDEQGKIRRYAFKEVEYILDEPHE